MAVIDPFPLPEAVAVHHAWSLEAVHPELDTTVKLVDPAAWETFWDDGVTLSVGAAPAWVTVTVTSGTPVAVMVMVATLAVVEMFSE